MPRFVFACAIAACGSLAIPAVTPLAQERALSEPAVDAVTADRGNDARGYGTSEAVFAHRDVQAVLGAAVQSAAGEDMGHVVQVLVDQAGLVRAAVIDFGGFLGVGSRKVVIDWAALHFAPENQPQKIMLDLTRDQVRAAPEYRIGKPVVVLGAAVAPGPAM